MRADTNVKALSNHDHNRQDLDRNEDIMPEIVAAVIGGFVGLFTALISSYLTNKNMRAVSASDLQSRTVQLSKQLEAQSDQLKDEIAIRLEDLRQTQALEVLKKRLEVYPRLYGIIANYGRSWEVAGKPFNNAWAKEFRDALLACNADTGVFFSDNVYLAYGALRNKLDEVEAATRAGGVAKREHILEIYAIIRARDEWDGRGLGTFMKDDLGGFLLGAISMRRKDDQIRYKQAMHSGTP